MSIKAILYDMDGPLIEARPIHRQAFDYALQTICGFILTDEEHEKVFNGLPSRVKLDILYKQGRVRKEQFQLIETIKQAKTIVSAVDTIKIDYSKINLHEWTKKQNIVSACCTNSIRKSTELFLTLSGQLRYFSFCITNEDVPEGQNKPDPACYLKAMRILGLFPHQCLIVEDSPKGIEAARNSRANVMVVSGPDDVNIENVARELEKYNAM